MINLLPPDEKELLQIADLRRRLLLSGAMLIIFLISLSLALSSGLVLLRGEEKSALVLLESYKNIPGYEDAAAVREEITLYNKVIGRIETILGREARATEVFEHIGAALPPEVFLKDFSYNSLRDISSSARYKKGSSIVLSGFSPDSDSLLLFKRNLEEDSLFTKVAFPPSVWIRQKDIEFTVTAEIVHYE